MSLGERLNRALATLLLQQHGAVVDPSRPQWGQASGGHNAQDDKRRPPTGNSRPPVQQWSERFGRMVERLEVEAGLHDAPVRVSRANIRQHLRAVMCEYEGCAPEEVAFWEDCGAQTVRDVRRDLKLHMGTGESLARVTVAPDRARDLEPDQLERNERPLTASPSTTLKALETE